MSKYSGLTLDQLEDLCETSSNDRAVLSGVLGELLRRKMGRENEGKNEKPRAQRLRISLAGKLGIDKVEGSQPQQTDPRRPRPSPAPAPRRPAPPARGCGI